MEFLLSLLRRHFAEKPAVASRNVGCFLRLTSCPHFPSLPCQVICVAQIFYYHFCRKVHVLDLVLVLDQEAAPDPKDGRDPSRVLLHNHATTVLNHDHVLDHDPDRHDANRIPSRAQGPGRDPVHDLRANPSPDHVHVHALDLDHPEMIKKHLRNRKLMIIRIIIQQKEIGPVKLMMLSDKMSFSWRFSLRDLSWLFFFSFYSLH